MFNYLSIEMLSNEKILAGIHLSWFPQHRAQYWRNAPDWVMEGYDPQYFEVLRGQSLYWGQRMLPVCILAAKLRLSIAEAIIIAEALGYDPAAIAKLRQLIAAAK